MIFFPFSYVKKHTYGGKKQRELLSNVTIIPIQMYYVIKLIPHDKFQNQE